MDKKGEKVMIDLDWLEGKSLDDIENLFSVTDQQAENSSADGDSDAEDGPAFSSSRNVTTRHDSGDSSVTSAADENINIRDSPERTSDRIPSPPIYEMDVDVEEDAPITWSERGTGRSKKFKNFHFDQHFGPNPGYRVDIGNFLNILSIFLTQKILTEIVLQSNNYAHQRGITLNLDVGELKAFLGILIVMGFHCLPQIKLYWSTKKNFRVDRIANIMSLKRFLLILRNIHINDNSLMPPRDSPQYDKLFKIRPLIAFLNSQYKKVFSPGRNISVDESMVAYKGRSTLKQYMPMKPTKRGFKVWAVCCATTGFLLGFEVYAGKGTEKGQSLGESVVLRLTQFLQGMGFIIFFDRFFSSIPLIKKLVARGLFACGTIMSNRKFLPKLKGDSELAFGQSESRSSTDLHVVKWKDRGARSVIVASSQWNPTRKVPVHRRTKKGDVESVQCPLPIKKYNSGMGGVDMFDQHMAYYSIAWKSRRWWMKLFYFMIDSTIINSYILYKSTCKQLRKKAISQLEFRDILGNQLIDAYQPKRKLKPYKVKITKAKFNPQRRSSSDVPGVSGGKHLPTTGTWRRCVRCSTREKPKRSNLLCKECGVTLCKGCFAAFHS